MQVCNSTTDRKHADVQLENYVTDTVMSIITTFFSSPFSDQSTNLQVCNILLFSSLRYVSVSVYFLFSKLILYY